MLEGVDAHLPPEAALLVTAKRRGRVVHVVRVDPHLSSLQLPRDIVGLLDVLGPYRRRETIGRVVGPSDRFLEVGEIDRGQHGTEHLLARDGHLRRDARKDGRLQKIAFARPDVGARAAGDQRGAFAFGNVDVAQIGLELLLRRDRAEPGLRIHRIARQDLPGARRDLLDELVFDRAVDQQARSRRAYFAFAVEDAGGRTAYRRVEVGVGKHDI